MDKRYCITCGKALAEEDQFCSHCGKPAQQKENLFLDFLLRHTKDKLKDEITGRTYDIVKGFLLSHLYGAIVTVSLVAVATTGVAAASAQPQKLPSRPESVAEVVVYTPEEREALVTEPVTEPESPTEAPTEPETTPPSYDLEAQVRVMADNYDMWRMAADYMEDAHIYTITDLDQDGLLEISPSVITGTGIFTTQRIFEVSAQMNGLIPIPLGYEGALVSDNAPDGYSSLNNIDNSQNVKIGYYKDGTYVYIMHNSTRDGWSYTAMSYDAVTMTADAIVPEFLGANTYTAGYNQEGGIDETQEYQVGDVIYDTEDAYYAALNALYADWTPFYYIHPSLGYNEITDLYTDLLHLAQQYSLTTDAPAQVQTTEAITYDLENQVAAMVENLDKFDLWPRLHWLSDAEAADVYETYSITDLDRDGLLEISCISLNNVTSLSCRNVFEVTPERDDLIQVAYYMEGCALGDFVNLEEKPFQDINYWVGYYQDGVYAYISKYYDVYSSDYYECRTMQVTMAGDSVKAEPLGLESYRISDSNLNSQEKTFTLRGQVLETKEAYNAAMMALYSDWTPFHYVHPILYRYAVTDLYTDLLNLAQQYSFTMESQ